MLSGLNGILLGRKAKCVISHRMEHIKAVEPLVTGKNVTCNISERVSHVQSGTARIREHIQNVVLRFITVFLSLEGLFLGPSGLPLAFD